MSMRTLMADVVLVAHFAVAASIAGGLALVWIGGWFEWRWTRNFAFRALHVGAIAFVAVQSLFGMHCPLTIWEDTLRGVHGQGSFVQRWVGRLLYFDLPAYAFTWAYVAAAVATVLAWWAYPPNSRRSVPVLRASLRNHR